MLSDSKIKTLKPQEKVYRILDAERLYIEVRPTGKKVWRLKYIFAGKEGSLSLGEYPAVTLLEARKKKDEIKAQLAKNINPSEHRKKEKAKATGGNTFIDLTKEYKEKRLNLKSDKYLQTFDRAMEKDVFPVIGKKDIKSVTSADVLKIIENTMSRIKKQKNFGTGEVTAIHNRNLIGAVMRYAIVTLRADYDPTQAVMGVVERPDVEHARPLTTNEAKKLRVKLEDYNGSQTVKNACFVLLYSMLRTIEVRRMQWSYVDFEQKIITFPVSSKTSGQKRTTKKNRIHVVPMSTQIVNILLEQHKVTGLQEYVFPSVYKTGMLSATTLNRVFDYIGLKEVTAHDFRATASTILNEKGYDQDWIEKQLAHADEDKTRASYNHAQYLDDRRKMLQDWADIVDSWNKYDE